MKNTVLKYGLIAGLIVTSVMVVATAWCYNDPEFKGSMVLGFASMIIAFIFIFIGIKNYRDKFNGGSITFGTAFLVGLYIALIASTMYVVVWLVEYYVFIPDFMDQYTAYMLKEAKASGISDADYNKKIAEMAEYKEMYKSPVMVVLMTYMEILPLGLVVALISAAVLKRKPVVV